MIHHVFACKSNIGDWLSALGIQSLLRPQAFTEHFCDEPFVPATIERLSRLSPRDLIVIGGGGLFMDYFTPFWEGFEPISRRVPFCIWGAGYCDLKQRHSQPDATLLRTIVARSRLCVVRDELTRQHLAGLIPEPPVACPSLEVIKPSRSPVHALLHSVHYNDIGHEVYEAMQAACKSFAAETGRSCSETENTIARDDAPSLAAALDQYAAADVVVSSRLHGCIIAVAMGRKVLAVSADRKTESFMKMAGLGEWVLDVTEVAAIPQRLAALAQQKPADQFLRQTSAANRHVAARINDLLASLDTTENP